MLVLHMLHVLCMLVVLGVSRATPIPANRVLQAADATAPTATFPTIIPTYTPTAPLYRREQEIKIMFNNKRELEQARQVQVTKTIGVSEATGGAREGGAVEYHLL
ncbi:uncharacterized protein CANTADRAFT_5454 [Suhomyces tanzawaensis NRRL Y-17324]|uniref:Secreted protein n=1 Tax=Suhomyces tanzawaensis NRRL Y-17324 TaxID=984487 RepID=A0A1E4SJX6_9ASCO|nr:uncharacterized protein CANTADRAFT_5454 [Suhomyces tanzawaensis NRRL Y-17324]ODV79737.1 hypothetical protein CANTADRAFT_5454 [Suhomyces tanzawaensis NRRL Y-17324]